MRTITTILVGFLITASSALAQTKLWTWTPTKKNATYNMLASDIGRDGSAVFVLGQYEGGDKHYIIVWVGPNGETRMANRIPTTDPDRVVFGWDQSVKWQIGIVGEKLVASDGRSLRIYGIVNGQGVREKLSLNTAAFFPQNSKFQGWLSAKTHSDWTFDPVSSESFEVSHIENVSLFKAE